jgi:hypothetical protein
MYENPKSGKKGQYRYAPVEGRSHPLPIALEEDQSCGSQSSAPMGNGSHQRHLREQSMYTGDCGRHHCERLQPKLRRCNPFFFQPLLKSEVWHTPSHFDCTSSQCTLSSDALPKAAGVAPTLLVLLCNQSRPLWRRRLRHPSIQAPKPRPDKQFLVPPVDSQPHSGVTSLKSHQSPVF